MAPKKQVNQVEARYKNELAMKQEVSVPDIIAYLKANFKGDAEQMEGLDRYLDKYNKGTLKAPAVTQLLRTLVGMDPVKGAIEVLVPGYTHTWAPATHEHPPIV